MEEDDNNSIYELSSFGWEIAILQIKLQIYFQSLNVVQVNGKYDFCTERAVKEVQQKIGREETGKVDWFTNEALTKGLNIRIEDQNINDIELVIQSNKRNCWAASIAMMTKSDETTIYNKAPRHLLHKEPTMQGDLTESEEDIKNGREIGKAIAETYRLVYYEPQPWSVYGILELIKNGPVLNLNAKAGANLRHAMVIVGAVSANYRDLWTYLYVYDPWLEDANHKKWVPYTNWFNAANADFKIFSREPNFDYQANAGRRPTQKNEKAVKTTLQGDDVSPVTPYVKPTPDNQKQQQKEWWHIFDN